MHLVMPWYSIGKIREVTKTLCESHKVDVERHTAILALALTLTQQISTHEHCLVLKKAASMTCTTNHTCRWCNYNIYYILKAILIGLHKYLRMSNTEHLQQLLSCSTLELQLYNNRLNNTMQSTCSAHSAVAKLTCAMTDEQQLC